MKLGYTKASYKSGKENKNTMKKDELHLSGQFTDAKVFTTNIDEETIAQIERLLNHPFSKGSQIRIMPDAHIGKGAVVGTTMTFSDKIVPDVVGVDIGCGMFVAQLTEKNLKRKDLQRLDEMIRKYVPSGTGIRQKPHRFIDSVPLDEIRAENVNKERAALSLGTLGGGNHFIELNIDEEGNHFLIIHSGSRSFGHSVASYYQQKAVEYWAERDNKNDENHYVDPEFAYLIGEDLQDYLHDIAIVQRFAYLNRKAMSLKIIEAMNWDISRSFDVIHNYVDIENRILRKGSISARKGEEIVIPINMRDGSILAMGKGNPEWNYSAPHGAGRLLSRTQARKQLEMRDFVKTMKDIYTTSVRKNTLDEAPFAYKPMKEILERTEDSFEIKAILKPIYNFKA